MSRTLRRALSIRSATPTTGSGPIGGAHVDAQVAVARVGLDPGAEPAHERAQIEGRARLVRQPRLRARELQELRQQGVEVGGAPVQHAREPRQPGAVGGLARGQPLGGGADGGHRVLELVHQIGEEDLVAAVALAEGDQHGVEGVGQIAELVAPADVDAGPRDGLGGALEDLLAQALDGARRSATTPTRPAPGPAPARTARASLPGGAIRTAPAARAACWPARARRPDRPPPRPGSQRCRCRGCPAWRSGSARRVRCRAPPLSPHGPPGVRRPLPSCGAPPPDPPRRTGRRGGSKSRCRPSDRRSRSGGHRDRSPAPGRRARGRPSPPERRDSPVAPTPASIARAISPATSAARSWVRSPNSASNQFVPLTATSGSATTAMAIPKAWLRSDRRLGPRAITPDARASGSRRRPPSRSRRIPAPRPRASGAGAGRRCR